MIKTLRITTIIAAALAVIFFVLPVVFGGRSNEEIEQFLNSAGVVEKFNKAADNKAKTGQSQTSPLVTQAEAFAKYLNPPPKPKPPRPPVARKPIVPQPRPPKASAKFTLVGTSVYAAHPELSLAFINEPGKGLRWVRQGSQVEHITISEVKDGLVVLQDGQRTFEIATQQKPERSLLEGSSPVSTAVGSGTAGAATTIGTPPQPSAKMIEKFMKSIQAIAESGKMDSQNIENLFSDFGSMRISDDEAKKLKNLPKEQFGPELTAEGLDTQQDPNQAKSRKLERPVFDPETQTRRARPRGLNRPAAAHRDEPRRRR